MGTPTWNRGDVVIWRSRPGGEVGYVIPMTVVIDSPGVTVLFQASGSICMRRAGTRGGPQGRQLVTATGGHRPRTFEGPPMLRIHQWGTDHAVMRAWDVESNAARDWYINLEAAWRRTSLGFDSEDHVLDVTLDDDLTEWQWKDEDEFAWKIETGQYGPDLAAAVRNEGERAGAAALAREWPFPEDWSAWAPNLNWPVPELPAGWNQPSLSTGADGVTLQRQP